jgi:outer membrane protein assembly factor BamB
MRKTTMRSILTVLALAGLVAADENWPQWRGPSNNGTSDSKGLPVSWSETENVKWKAKLPSWSGSTPIVWGERIFVTSPNAGAEAKNVKAMGGQRKPEGLDILLLCLSKKDGAELWRSSISGANYQIGKQNMSSPSPVTDGKHVWWLTGTGHLTALTVEGKQVWQVELQKLYGKFGLNWGFAASPLLYEGLVIVPVMHGMTTDDPSYLVAFEGETGKPVWRVERPTDAENESPDAYTTVYPMKTGDHVELVVIAGDCFTGHDPKTGKELWRAGGLNPKKDKWFRAVSSPGVAGDLVIGCIKKAPVVAVKVGGKGDVTSTHTAWTSDAVYDVPTPVFDGTHLYILDDAGFLNCLDPKTGKAVYKKERLPKGTYSASPLLAEGRLYLTSERGRTTVVEAGPAFKILAENQLDDDYTLSSIAVSGSELFIRTSTSLYCVAKKP